ERIRLRREGRVAESNRQVGYRRGRLDGERVVVDDGQAGERLDRRVLGVDLGEALDRLEEVAATLAVRSEGGVVPRIDEVLGLDLGPVLEHVALLDLHRE